MKIQEFNYSSITQRRLVLLSVFFSIATLVVGTVITILGITSLALYTPVWKYILTLAFSGLLFGIIAGSAILRKLQNHRIIIITQEVIVSCVAIAPVIGLLIYSDSTLRYIQILQHYYWLPYTVIFILYFCSGIKASYFLKTTSGDYIDNKNPAAMAILVALTSFIISAACGVYIYYHPYYLICYIIFPILSFVITLFLTLPFCPPVIISKGIQEETYITSRDDILFTYCNVSFIVIFTILILVTIVARHGLFLHIILYSLIAIIVSFIIGAIASQFIKTHTTVFIYGEMLYPFLFLAFIIVNHSNTIPYYASIIAAAPFSVFAGLTFGTSLQQIVLKNNHQSRYTLLLFSFFIIPIPIIIAFIWIELTYLWFFMLIYVLAIVTIVFPGLYLLQNTKRSVSSILYFVISLLFIPAIIITHIYFKLPFSNTLVHRYCSGYDSIAMANFNSSFITQPATAYIQGIPVCSLNEHSARDIKRSIVLSSLFTGSGHTIVIDGYHKFFTNNLYSILPSPVIIDYIPDRIVDYQKPTITGVEQYATVHSNILAAIYGKKGTIIDIPNIFDHYMYAFRFSDAYIASIKQHVDDYYFMIIDVTHLPLQHLSSFSAALQKHFSHTLVAIYGNHMIIGATNMPTGFVIDQAKVQKLENLIQTTPVSNIFINAEHALSYILYTSVQSIVPPDSKHEYMVLNFKKPDVVSYHNSYAQTVIATNDAVISFADKTPYWVNTLQVRMFYAKRINELLKQSEYYGIQQQFEREMQTLMDLRRAGEYMPSLRQYIINVISYKEKLYENIAFLYEKDKQWDKAISLYSAMLAVNPNNFTANYRIGIISATIQNMDNAFKYLNNAMRINPNNPDVLYQLGILLISQGKYPEALNYLLQAHQMNMATASLFFNIGLCYESLKNLEEAKRYYEKAKLLDPNDPSIQSSLERFSGKKDEPTNQNDSRTNQLDEEKGESFPLPINQSAYDVRLKENELKDEDKVNMPR
ncbi:MAG: tetratricopeptide repeat protein [Spirochaetes bacterium]|nr:tetratricopeptide repeat protein [Spirochaetota bacterium]